MSNYRLTILKHVAKFMSLIVNMNNLYFLCTLLICVCFASSFIIVDTSRVVCTKVTKQSISGLDIFIPLERSQWALQDGGNHFLIGQFIFA